MFSFAFLEHDDMIQYGVYRYPGLNQNQIVEIYYNEDASQAVVKTMQENIPENIQQITEELFNQYAAQWSSDEQNNGQVVTKVTLEELNEKLDLLTMMQLEKEGIL